MPRTNERVVNGILAEQLRLQHPRWRERIDNRDNLAAEQTRALDGHPNLAVDIVIRSSSGQPVVVETEYHPAPDVEKDAKSRLGHSIDGRRVEGALAVKIPKSLALNQTGLGVAINEQEFEYCMIHGTADHNDRWPVSGWLKGRVPELADAIEYVSQAETINRATDILERGIEDGERLLRTRQANHPQMLPAMANLLYQEDSVQTTRMAVAIIANAFVFQTAIAGNHDIATPGKLLEQNETSLFVTVRKCWQEILATNYWPIFNIARDLLSPIPEVAAKPFLENMINLAGSLADLGSASMHDLSGQMFQRLISDRKFLATFYTLPSSASLLANLAVSRLPIDWSNKVAIKHLRIADFACGTGTLISAAQHAIAVRYRRTGGDDRDLHTCMMEDIMVATDIMPAATHLTASTLSSAHPSICFDETNIFTLPYGCESGEVRIGALDLIDNKFIRNLFGTGSARRSGGRSERAQQTSVIEHESCDLVIMNPPFTNPTNHESTEVPVPSFAGFGTSREEQKAMSNRLKKIRDELKKRRGMDDLAEFHPELAGHGNAGLASNFIDIAHTKLSSGGCLALVVPASFAQGAATSNVRKMLADFYDDVIVIAISTDGHKDRAFSADTGMGEILLLGTKRERRRSQNDTKTFKKSVLTVNLNHRPRNHLEGSLFAKAIAEARLGKDNSGRLVLGENIEPFGSFLFAPPQNAFKATGVRELNVIQALITLNDGKFIHPQTKAEYSLPITKLSNLGHSGKGSRDINGAGGRGPFDIVGILDGEYPTFPVLWAHHAGQNDGVKERRLVVNPDSSGIVRTNCNAEAFDLWRDSASRLHFNLNFQINSQSLAACLTERPTIGGEAWPSFLAQEPNWEIPILLWANTTFGLMTFWWTGTRQQQGRSRLTRTQRGKYLSIDPRKLNINQLNKAKEIFKHFKDKVFLPANEAYRDKNRQKLDEAILTDLLCLEPTIFDGINILREQWCREPSVHGGKATRPS